MTNQMEPLQAHETSLEGHWLKQNDENVPDEIQQRIRWLVGTQLTIVSPKSGGWEVLYRDERDGRYWELTFADIAQGGGPWKLTAVSNEYVTKHY